MTDEARDQEAAGSAGAEGADAPSLESWSGAQEQSTWTPIDPDAATGAGERVRRPSSLLGDTPIPPRAAALRASLSDKIASVSHGGSGDAPAAGGMGAGGTGGRIPSGGPVPPPGEELIERLRTLIAERPEVAVGAAFVGGLLLASILKRLAR